MCEILTPGRRKPPVAPISREISEDGQSPLTISSGLRIPNWTRFTGLSGADEFSRAAILVLTDGKRRTNALLVKKKITVILVHVGRWTSAILQLTFTIAILRQDGLREPFFRYFPSH